MNLLNRVLRYWYFGLTLLVLSCQHPNPETDIEILLEELIEADNNEDLNRIASLYNTNAILMPPAGEAIVGIEAITDHYDNLFQNFEFYDLSFKSHETIITDHWAVNIGITKGVIEVSSTDSTMNVNDKYVMVLKKNNSKEWEIHRLIWNKSP